MALRYFTLSSSLCAETIVGAWEVRLEKNMERVRAMLGISFYLYEVGSARAPKGFPWWTAGMKIDPRVPNTLIRKDYSIVNFTNIYSVSTQIRYLSKPQKWHSEIERRRIVKDGRSQKAKQKRLISTISLFSLVFKRRATGEKAPSSAHRESAKSALFL